MSSELSTDSVVVAPGDRPDATPEEPWLGLRSFTEQVQDYFFGRDPEIKEIFERVIHLPLTILFGQSGLGKTSLMRAGVIPRLKDEGYHPVLIRLIHDRKIDPQDLNEQVLWEIRRKVPDCGVLMLSASSLWELFHDPLFGFVGDDSAESRRPVLVFDQFEEIFTLGHEKRADDAREFLESLACLIENRPPPDIRERLRHDDEFADRLIPSARPCRVVIALRDDFLNRLERWRHQMPSIMQNRFELRLLSGSQAFDAVYEPGRKRTATGDKPPILSAQTAETIVRIVAGRDDTTPLDEIENVPPLLSLICEQLNAQRIRDGLDMLETDHVQHATGAVLRQFYESCFSSHPDAARRFVERRLISDSGFRESISIDSAKAELKKSGVSDPPAVIDDLVHQRLLTVEDRGGVERIELTHDILAPVVRESRDAVDEKRSVRLAFQIAGSAERGWLQQLRDRVWGYDFYISYHWASGGTYAVNLAARLREAGYDVFLDRAEHALGDDWRHNGAVALRRSRRLILIATPEAVLESRWVEREVTFFGESGRSCTPIVFGDTFDELLATGAVGDRLSGRLQGTLQIRESIDNQSIGPDHQVIDRLVASHGLLSRRRLRKGAYVLSAIALAAIAVVSWLQRNHALEALRSQVDVAKAATKTAEGALRSLQQETTRREAAAFMAGISGSEDYPTANEYESLRLLAESDMETRLEFLSQMLSSPVKAENLRHRYAYLLHAIVGLDTHARDRVRELLTEHGRDTSRNGLTVKTAIVELGLLLSFEDAAFDKLVASNIVSVMTETTDPQALNSLSDRLSSLGDKLPVDQATDVAKQLISAMAEAANWDALKWLSGGLGSLGEKLPAELATDVAKQLISAMAETTDPYALRWLSDRLVSLGEKLPAEQATAGAKHLMSAMTETTNWDALRSLSGGLDSLGWKLPADLAVDGAKQLIAAMTEMTDPNALSLLSGGLGALGGNLPTEQATDVAKQLISAMAETTDPNALSSLSGGLGALGGNLPTEQATDVAKQLISAMAETTDPDALRWLSAGLGSLDGNLPAEQATDGAKQLISTMAETTDPDALSSLSGGLGSLGDKLPAEQATHGARQLISAMTETTDPDALKWLSAGLGSLGDRLPAEQATDGAKQLISAMAETTDPYALRWLSAGLGSLGDELPVEQATHGAKRLIAAMAESTDPTALSWLSYGLGALGDKLPTEQATDVAKRLIAAMAETSDPDALAWLSSGLGALGDKLPAEQATDGAKRLIAVMKETTDSIALSSLSMWLNSLVENLPAEQATDVAKQLIPVMTETTKSFARNLHSGVLVSLVENLPAEQAMDVAKQLIAAMTETTDPGALSSLSAGLGALGGNLPAEQATNGAKQLIAVMTETTDPTALSSLSARLRSLGDKLSADQATDGAKQLIAAMKETTDPDALRWLSVCLVSLGENLPADQAAAGAKQLISAMQETINPFALGSLTTGLVSLSENLPADQATAVAKHLITLMSKTTDSSLLAAGLGSLVVSMDETGVATVLQSLPCVAETRKHVLTGLEKKSGQEFGGNLWKAVEWLESRGVDVNSVSRFPISSNE